MPDESLSYLRSRTTRAAYEWRRDFAIHELCEVKLIKPCFGLNIRGAVAQVAEPLLRRRVEKLRDQNASSIGEVVRHEKLHVGDLRVDFQLGLALRSQAAEK